jgi:hypothetical protein
MTKEEDTAEPVSLFICGPNVCPKGGDHEWGDELVKIDECCESIVCTKCGAPKMYSDMWDV